jgi:hypothetical protein
MMMVHQLCLLPKVLQVIKTIGVHLLITGVEQTLELLVPKQVIGMHQPPLIPVQLAGDFIKSLFFLSIIKPHTRIRTMLLQINNNINNSSSNTVLYH